MTLEGEASERSRRNTIFGQSVLHGKEGNLPPADRLEAPSISHNVLLRWRTQKEYPMVSNLPHRLKVGKFGTFCHDEDSCYCCIVLSFSDLYKKPLLESKLHLIALFRRKGLLMRLSSEAILAIDSEGSEGPFEDMDG